MPVELLSIHLQGKPPMHQDVSSSSVIIINNTGNINKQLYEHNTSFKNEVMFATVLHHTTRCSWGKCHRSMAACHSSFHRADPKQLLQLYSVLLQHAAIMHTTPYLYSCCCCAIAARGPLCCLPARPSFTLAKPSGPTQSSPLCMGLSWAAHPGSKG